MLGYSRTKIARAKNSCHDLSIMAKTVGSNFFLKDRQLSASFKKGGFDTLSAEAGAESATSRPSPNSYWLPGLDSNQESSPSKGDVLPLDDPGIQYNFTIFYWLFQFNINFFTIFKP